MSKSLFLGLLDLALVNAYIIHREHNKRLGKSGLNHSGFLTTLHAQLLAIQSEDVLETPSVSYLRQFFLHCEVELLTWLCSSKSHYNPRLLSHVGLWVEV